MILQLIIYIISIFIVISIAFYTIKNGISPSPTSPLIKKELLSLFPTSAGNSKLYELGAGWGTLAFPLAKQLPNSAIYAIENSLIPYLWMMLRNKLTKQSNIVLLRQNIYNIDLSEANYIVCYLYPKAMKKLEVKCRNECSKGTIIIAHTFAFPTLAPLRTMEAKDIYRSKIYIYRL